MLFFGTGLLKVGVPKTWDESKKDLGYIRKAGVRQFISTYNRVRDLKGDELLWVSRQGRIRAWRVLKEKKNA